RLRSIIKNWRDYLMDNAHTGVSEVSNHFLRGMKYLFGFTSGGLYSPETGEWFTGEYEHIGDITERPRNYTEADCAVFRPGYQGGVDHLDMQQSMIWSVPNIVSPLPNLPHPALQLSSVGI